MMYRKADDAPVYIAPEHVVKLEPMHEGFATRITPITGEPEVVWGAPSEVNGRLRRGQ